ncbi:MAG: hypothetical protein JWN11_739, partial [Hyphomicrobiales bacterium]|nr:hypothetical protein [Hyphomicrobiales bacterium]
MSGDEAPLLLQLQRPDHGLGLHFRVKL